MRSAAGHNLRGDGSDTEQWRHRVLCACVASSAEERMMATLTSPRLQAVGAWAIVLRLALRCECISNMFRTCVIAQRFSSWRRHGGDSQRGGLAQPCLDKKVKPQLCLSVETQECGSMRRQSLAIRPGGTACYSPWWHRLLYAFVALLAIHPYGIAQGASFVLLFSSCGSVRMCVSRFFFQTLTVCDRPK